MLLVLCVDLPLCVCRLNNLIQNLLRRHQKDLLIVQLPVKRNRYINIVYSNYISTILIIDTLYYKYDSFFNKLLKNRIYYNDITYNDK